MFQSRLCLGLTTALMFGAIAVTGCSTAPTCPECPAPISEEPVDDAEATSDNAGAIDAVVLSVDDADHRVAPNGETSVVWLAQGENAYVGQITLAPHTEVPLHRHDSEEYLYITEGSGVMTIDGQDYLLEPGTMVLVPRGAEHGFVNGDETTRAFQVFASPEGAQRFLEWPHAPTAADD